MCSDLLLNKMMCFHDTCSENFVIIAEKYPWRSLMLMQLAVCRVAIISKEVLRQIYFLGIYEIFDINSSNLDY